MNEKCSNGHEICNYFAMKKTGEYGFCNKCGASVKHSGMHHTCGTIPGDPCVEGDEFIDNPAGVILDTLIESVEGETQEAQHSESEEKKLERLPSVLESYASSIEWRTKRHGPLPNTDSDLAPTLKSAATRIRSLKVRLEEAGTIIDTNSAGFLSWERDFKREQERAETAEAERDEWKGKETVTSAMSRFHKKRAELSEAELTQAEAKIAALVDAVEKLQPWSHGQHYEPSWKSLHELAANLPEAAQAMLDKVARYDQLEKDWKQRDVDNESIIQSQVAGRLLEAAALGNPAELQAEIERLREALEEITNLPFEGDTKVYHTEQIIEKALAGEGE